MLASGGRSGIGPSNIPGGPVAPARCSVLIYSTAEGANGKALAAHISNAHVRESAAGIMVRKADKDSPAKMDLAVCSIMALDRATRSKGRKAF